MGSKITASTAAAVEHHRWCGPAARETFVRATFTRQFAETRPKRSHVVCELYRDMSSKSRTGKAAGAALRIVSLNRIDYRACDRRETWYTNERVEKVTWKMKRISPSTHRMSFSRTGEVLGIKESRLVQLRDTHSMLRYTHRHENAVEYTHIVFLNKV